ncbi:MAG: flagellar filament capping protein FliD [Aminipila sp.]
MANINNVSQTSSSSSYVAKGISGLASGMNTEEIVEKMTSDIQAKIDKVKQEQQKYTWKQEAYREVISSLVSFQDKYFSFSSSTNLLSSSFFNATTMVAGGSNAGKISVSGVASTNKPTYSVTGVSQLATKSSFSSGGIKTAQKIETGEISFGEREASLLTNGSVSIKYGDKVYTVDIPSDATINDPQSLVDALNKSMTQNNLSIGGTLAEKLEFSLGDDGKVSLNAINPTDSNLFSISGGTNPVLNALHMTSGTEAVDGKITASEVTKKEDLVHNVKFDLTGKSLTFDLNGSSKTIAFTAEDSEKVTDIESLKTLLQEKIDDKFGKNKIKVSIPTDSTGALENKISFGTVKLDSSGNEVVDETSLLKITSATSDTLSSSGVFNLEDGAQNRLNTSKTLKELGFTPSGTDEQGKPQYKLKVNGVEFAFGEDDTINKVINTINNDREAGVNITYLSTSGRFSVMADESGVQGKVEFEDMGGDLVLGLFGTKDQMDSSMIHGQDMKMTIRYDGSDTDVEINRSSNNVSIDGINFTANGTFSAYNKDGVYNKEDAISFTTKSETDNIVSTIKSMAEDYNKMLDSINKLTSTKANRKYPPLTDAQKKEMKPEEIKLWEDKAKEGILFGDSTLNQLASDMRFMFSTAINNVGTASSIGITTSSSYSDNGKIVIDEKKLKEALESDPEKVKSIFISSADASPSLTGSGRLAGGLSIRMKTTMEAYAKSTGSYKGKLVDLAGIKNNATTSDNYIDRQQKILNAKLESLEKVLKKRRDRYQGQFSNLEVYLSKMNAQSSWLASATGGN